MKTYRLPKAQTLKLNSEGKEALRTIQDLRTLRIPDSLAGFRSLDRLYEDARELEGEQVAALIKSAGIDLDPETEEEPWIVRHRGQWELRMTAPSQDTGDETVTRRWKLVN